MTTKNEIRSVNKQKKLPKKNDDFLTVVQAAELYRVTRGSITMAIRAGRLRSQKRLIKRHYIWYIHRDDLLKYKISRNDRKFSKYNGELIFDHTRGLYSVDDVSKILGLNTQRVYYAIRSGKIKTYRTGRKKSVIVIPIDDVKKFKSELQELLWYRKSVSQSKTKKEN